MNMIVERRTRDPPLIEDSGEDPRIFFRAEIAGGWGQWHTQILEAWCSEIWASLPFRLVPSASQLSSSAA
jgi:hypothetical protein